MINKIETGVYNIQNRYGSPNHTAPVFSNNSEISAAKERNYSPERLMNAYQAYNGINTAKTVSFGKGLSEAFNDLNKSMIACNKEEVGQRAAASDIIDEYYNDLPNIYDAIKTDIVVSEDTKNDTKTKARTQLKKTKDGVMFEMAVRQPAEDDEIPDKSKPLLQLIKIIQTPESEERAYILNTKGKLMAVVEDGENVLLTNAGEFSKRSEEADAVKVIALQDKNVFTPFTPEPQEVKERHPEPSIGEGTEIVIGMQNNRFEPAIIDSIETFVDKINNEEIVLDRFVANPDAKNTQLAILAGGYGSRAEYTNASSSKIFHGVNDGSESTKGVFRTATGLTPMETTFITLHNAGLLDCSKGKLKIGDNIKFYSNESEVNKGNGGFTVGLFDKMERDDRKSLAVFSNDAISRMTNAVKEMTDIMNTGEAAVVIAAKEVKSDDAKGTFGIMKLGENNQILEFAEKPKVIPDGYEKDGKCLTNTFQFIVSKEAFEALELLENFFPSGEDKKESRDWSKTYIPILMSLTLKDDTAEIKDDISEIVDAEDNQIPDYAIETAKTILGGQKIYAVPTDEPWADCGTLNALYHTTMQIANNDFPLEDFERKHVLDSINTQTGLVASTPEQKNEIESRYNISGQVMAVPQAKKIDPSIVDEYKKKNLITVNN